MYLVSRHSEGHSRSSTTILSTKQIAYDFLCYTTSSYVISLSDSPDFETIMINNTVSDLRRLVRGLTLKIHHDHENCRKMGFCS